MKVSATEVNRISRGSTAGSLYFLLGLCSQFSVNLQGQLFIADIVWIPMIFLLQFDSMKEVIQGKTREKFNKVVFLGLLWIVAFLISSVLRQDSLIEMFKYSLSIAITLILIFILFRSRTEFLIRFAQGFALSSILFSILSPVSTALADYWKWGVGFNSAILLGAVVFKSKAVTTNLLLLASVISVFASARSLAFIFFVSAIAVILKKRPVQSKIRSKFLLRTIVFSVITICFTSFYSFASSSGLLGEEAKNEYLSQSYNGLPLIVNGRSEFLFALEVIKENPIVGQGAYPRLSGQLKIQAQERLERLEINLERFKNTLGSEDRLIPLHSHIWGAWVTSGIFGVFFWIYLLYLFSNFILIEWFRVETHKGFYICLLFSGWMLWEIPFSPFGGSKRIVTALAVALVLKMSPSRKKRNA